MYTFVIFWKFITKGNRSSRVKCRLAELVRRSGEADAFRFCIVTIIVWVVKVIWLLLWALILHNFHQLTHIWTNKNDNKIMMNELNNKRYRDVEEKKTVERNYNSPEVFLYTTFSTIESNCLLFSFEDIACLLFSFLHSRSSLNFDALHIY